jgi:hypothetical protein
MKPTLFGSKLIPLAAVPAALTTVLANGLAWALAWLATRFTALSSAFTDARITYREALQTKSTRASYYDPRAVSGTGR